MAVIGAARSALLVGPDPGSDDPHRHLLVQTKTNLAEAPTLVYRTFMQEGVLGVEWLGVSERTAQDLAAVGHGERSALQEAMYVLYSLLTDGPVPAREVIQLAARAGVCKRTLDRAKKGLGVVARKRGSGPGSRWTWELPADEGSFRAFKERDLDELMERLLNGEEGPPVPGDEWKEGLGGEDEEEGGPGLGV
jgi:putative DNA primase/helicase